MRKVIDNLKYIMPRDMLAPFIFVFALIPGFFYKLYLLVINKPLWLICENGDTARDNGYYFYKYMREKHPEINCRYVIKKQSRDHDKVAKIGVKPVQAFGIKHYIMYLAAKWNISNHKNGNPNQVLFYIIHVTLKLINNRVFLQHGVIKDDLPFVHFKNARFKYFVTSAKREFDYVNNKFGYPEGSIILTGLPRFDTLIDNSKNKNKILIMPTWRNWLGRETNALHKIDNFENTDFYKNWNALINSDNFINWLEKNNKTAVFYPHLNMQRYIQYFKSSSKRIKVADLNTDIQKVLRDSYFMITDYSSVYMDFAYMRKPVVYFQFDYDEYRKKHLSPGYFDYKKDGFGPIFDKPEDVVNAINETKKYSKKYEKRCDDFFPENDYKNCERIFNILSKNEEARC